jgi:hypothetical protein
MLKRHVRPERTTHRPPAHWPVRNEWDEEADWYVYCGPDETKDTNAQSE